MTPEERQLVTGLFDRMQSVGVAKDREADQLIRETVRQIPDAPYLLVQSVLVQEQALQQADQRIRELEERVASLSSGDPGQSQSAGRGSFLGGARGVQPRSESSVPPAGRQLSDAPAGDGPLPGGDTNRPPSQPFGGGFLASALSTATGVTGGMLLADSIRNLFGMGHPGDGGSSTALDRARDEAQDARSDADTARKELAADDAALDDAQDALDDDGDWDDDGGFDV